MLRRSVRSRVQRVLFGAALALALAVQPAADAAPSGAGAADLPEVGTVTRQLVRPGAARPEVVAGVLTAPSSAAPATVARRYLDSAPAVLGGADPAGFAVERVVELNRGHAIRYNQSHRGLQVIGGEAVVRVDGAGRVRWAASRAQPIPATLSTTPTVAAPAVVRTVALGAGYDQAEIAAFDPGRFTRLVVYAQPDNPPRLAWWVELPRDMARMQTIRAFVDAETGRVLRRENRVRHGGEPALPVCPEAEALAYVYDRSPVQSDLSCVSLAEWLPEQSTDLINEDVATANCVDNRNCTEVPVPGFGTVNVHFCDIAPTAVPDVEGHFTEYVFESDTEPEDDFAQVQMFYHVNKAFERARALGGFTDLVNKPLAAIVNLRIPDVDFLDPTTFLAVICTGDTYTGDLQLQPFNNAAFMPQGALFGFPEEDSIVFFQGTTRDFAYDGDVVYHEFGHALMATVAPQLAFGFIDTYGFNPQPGGMHEGYADLMAMWVTNHPAIGEYAGAGLAGPGASSIRNLDNTATCPEQLIGQVHLDSVPFTGAFWQARTTVATTAELETAFDEATFAAQQTLGAFDDFTAAAAKTVSEIELMIDGTAAAAVAEIFEQRGMNGCNDRVLDGSSTKELLFVTGTDSLPDAPEVPGPVQWRYELPEDAVEITLNIQASGRPALGGALGGGDSGPNLELVLKGGGEEIRWTQAAIGDYTSAGPVELATTGLGEGSGTVRGGFPAGTYHLQLINKGPTWIVENVSLSHTAGDLTPDAGPDAGPGADDGSGDCGCVVAPPAGNLPAGPIALTLLAVGFLAFARRRCGTE